jgi:2-keto-3-deoxy-L-rhamnonate aldolase RhmA
MSKVPAEPGVSGPGLARKLRSGAPVSGTFVKTTSGQIVEVLARSGLDFLVLDAEHAPFGVEALDKALCAARAAGIDALVRVPSHDPAFINSCLDMGASGIVAPHVKSAQDAQAIVDAVKYGRGKRGFSGSGRAGNYGAFGAAAYRADADASSMIWCQIEDKSALDHLDAIAAVDEVDCLFIGPADLGLSLGCEGPDDPRLADAIVAIAEAGRRHDRIVSLFVPDTGSVPSMLALGISVFICGSDQSLLLGKAKQVADAMRAATSR